MSQETLEQLANTAGRLASAAETLDHVLTRLDAQQESLNARVDRIVAAVEDRSQDIPINVSGHPQAWEQRVAELEKANTELKAQASRMARKTLSPLASAMLSKSSDAGDHLDAAALDKTLQSLSVEQRIAVKAEMARAGMIE
jgi:archaellum component FlaC